MKKLLMVVLVLITTVSFAWTQRAPQDVQTCAVHARYGFPQTSGVQPICRQAYLVGYDAAAKLPKFVTYQLLPQNAIVVLHVLMHLLLTNLYQMAPDQMIMQPQVTTKVI